MKSIIHKMSVGLFLLVTIMASNALAGGGESASGARGGGHNEGEISINGSNWVLICPKQTYDCSSINLDCLHASEFTDLKSICDSLDAQ